MAVQLHDGPLASLAAGDWVEIPASSLYIAQAIGYVTIEFSLDGVNAMSPSSGTIQSVGTSGPPDQILKVTNLPAAFARAKSIQGADQASVELYLQEA